MKCWRTRLVILSRIIILIPLFSASLVSSAVTAGQNDPASQAMERGKEAFKIGELEKAAEHWTEADHLYAKAGDRNGQIQALLKIAKARQAQGNQAFTAGDFGSAADHYMETAQLYEWVGDINRRSLALLQQAEALQAQGNYKEALDQIAISDKLAKELFHKSKYAQAADSWTQIVRLSKQEPAPDLPYQLEKLLQLSEALQYQGRYLDSINVLKEAEILNTKIGEKDRHRRKAAVIWGRLGNAHAAREEVEPALEYLTNGLREVRPDDSSLRAGLLNDRGNVLAVQAARKYQKEKELTEQKLLTEAGEAGKEAEKYIDRALNDFSKATGEAAKEPRNRGLEITAVLNRSKALVIKNYYKRAKVQALQASQLIRELPISRQKAYALVDLGLVFQDLRTGLPDYDKSLFQSAEQSFVEATDIAKTLENTQAEAYAWGQLGSLSEKESQKKDGQKKEALTIKAIEQTRKALSVLESQMIKTTPSLYQWEWQLARLLKQNGNKKDAYHAYKRAVSALKNAPRNMRRGYQWRKKTFRDGPGRLYLELSDIYLTEPSLAKGEEKSPLELARVVMEDFKRAEIQDYYQDDCVDAYEGKLKTIDQVSKGENTAVIYPILFRDRLEILATISGKPHRVSPQDISEEEIRETVYAFRKSLQKLGELNREEIVAFVLRGEEAYPELLKYGSTLYAWLIKPLEHMLNPNDTVIFVPDGALRMIPLAALYDSKAKKYVIQKYAVATASGFQLPDPKGMDRDKLKVLYMGLATGGTVDGKEFSKLKGVKDELKTLQDIYGKDDKDKVKSYMNDQFNKENVKNDMKDKAYTVIHLATHAVFANDINKSYILASENQKIDINDLREMIGIFKYREQPLDLLTLSACETAVGDEQAALGLASVAINAGARSALATLWSVRDTPSSSLIKMFYTELKKPKMTKAKALQIAQQDMVKEKSLWKHPYFWSGFLLLNNWL